MVLCDRCGMRMPAVRATMEAKIGKAYCGLDLTIDCFPEDDVPDDPSAAIRVRGSCTRRVMRHHKMRLLRLSLCCIHMFAVGVAMAICL